MARAGEWEIVAFVQLVQTCAGRTEGTGRGCSRNGHRASLCALFMPPFSQYEGSTIQKFTSIRITVIVFFYEILLEGGILSLPVVSRAVARTFL